MIVAAFFFPLALYCFVLGLLNKRRRPLMVPATWDFAGLLFAASGFLLFGVPAMLSGASERWRDFWLVGRAKGLNDTPGIYYGFWLGVFIAYFLIVVGLSLLVLLRRRRQTAVYNVDPAVFEEVLAGALDVLGLRWSRSGNRYFLREGVKGTDGEEETGITLGPPPEPLGDSPQSASLEIDLARVLHHVTLRWDDPDGLLREKVEGELRQALEEVRTRHNPVGGIMLSLGGLLLASTVLAFALALYVRMFGR